MITCANCVRRILWQWLLPLTTLSLAVAAAPLPAVEASSQAEVSLAEVRELGLAALTPQARQLPGLDLEVHENPAFPRFHFILVTWGEAEGTRGGTVEQLAVDRVTGDVWSGLVCREFKSAELRRVQAAVRKRLGLERAAYKKLRCKGPMC